MEAAMKTGRAQNKTSTSSQQQSSASNPSASNYKTAEQIAITAYLKAQARGFEPGHELEDWLAAEAEHQ
jgi:hypothetical protein